jgi:hypothetical protein
LPRAPEADRHYAARGETRCLGRLHISARACRIQKRNGPSSTLARPEHGADGLATRSNGIHLQLFGAISGVMRSAVLTRPPDSGNPDAERGEVIAQWIGDDAHGGQVDYFLSRAVQRTRQHRFTDSVAGDASACGPMAIQARATIGARIALSV